MEARAREKRDAFREELNKTREKRDALRGHLNRVDARKNDYKIVKGEAPKKTMTTVSSKATLKSVSRDFERAAMNSLKNGDMGSQAVGMSYEVAKTTIVASARLVAINERIVNGTVKVVNDGVRIGKTAYKVGSTMSLAVRTGTVKGYVNLYKDMAFQKMGTAIKYSKPVYVIRNVKDGVKTVLLDSRYNYARAMTFVKGCKAGTIKVTAKGVAKGAGAFAGRTALAATKGTGKLIYKSAKGLGKLSRTRIVRGSLKGARNAIKDLGNNGDDLGMKAVGTAVDSARYTFQALKTTGRAGAGVYKTAKGAGTGVYKTARGTYRFVRDARRRGIKGASKAWYNAHLKGAGRTLKEKFVQKLKTAFKKLLCSPIVLCFVALLVCTVLLTNTVVVCATSVVGGVIEKFEELAEGLQDVWDKVTTAIADFFRGCAAWLVKLFGGGSSTPSVSVDVDVGNSMSICDYLLGATQLYKAEFSLKIAEIHDKLINEEGYHGVIIYNLLGDKMEVHDINEPDKGLMSDKAYVKAMLPVWKAIILGTIGTKFTGKQANRVSKDCFRALTEMREEPYVDLNGDGVADYSYCNGSNSMSEGENFVVTHIGGVLQSGMNPVCYNNTGTMYHTSHNADGLACCVTQYRCGGHLRCDGHVQPCPGHLTCPGHVKNGVTTYCSGCTMTYCGGGCLVTYCGGCIQYNCYDGISPVPKGCSTEVQVFHCNGYNLCKGHKIMKIYLGSHGFDRLLEVKFTNRIKELEARGGDLTKEERQELSQLRMFYEYALSCQKNGDPIADEFFKTP